MTEEKRKRVPPKGSLRHLRGWSELTDEEFDKKYSEVVFGAQRDEAIQAKIDKYTQEFTAEYDLSDLLPNDRAVLKNLIQAMVLLDMYQGQLFNLTKQGGLDETKILQMDKLGKICDQLTNNISRMQDDLNIIRRKRKTDAETSLINMMADLKKKAQEFYEQKMNYIICPSCGETLGTVWFLYPEGKNTIELVCQREIDGKACSTKVKVTSKELLDNGGSNKKEVIPEALR